MEAGSFAVGVVAGIGLCALAGAVVLEARRHRAAVRARVDHAEMLEYLERSYPEPGE